LCRFAFSDEIVVQQNPSPKIFADHFFDMAQPNLAPSKPKKKKTPRKPTPKQLAKEKYEKRLEEFKVASCTL